MALEKTYQAVVQKVIVNGKHGPYAVAECEETGRIITFSLDKESWKEDEWPGRGMFVMLSKLRKKRAGWRAHVGRFVTPSDD